MRILDDFLFIAIYSSLGKQTGTLKDKQDQNALDLQHMTAFKENDFYSIQCQFVSRDNTVL